jgi:quinol monooxygenase YgiN
LLKLDVEQLKEAVAAASSTTLKPAQDTIVQKLVAATEKEPGTLEYEYAVGDDQKTVDIFERYTNSHAAVVHVTENFGPNFSKEFMAVAKPIRFVVYGVPTDELKKALADFRPIYMTPFDGFTK